MGSERVKLIGAWPSPFTVRVRVALNIKSVEYEFLEEKFGAKSELLLKSNPVYKKFPVLIDGDKTICESLIIVQYIDDVWASGPAILPSDPHERAIARFWAAYFDDKWYPLVKAILMAEGDEAKNAATEEAKPGLNLLEEAFINCSKGQKFFGGDKIGYLDLAVGSFLGWIRVIHKMANVKLIDEAQTPNLFKWAHDFSADAAVKDVLPEADKLVEIAKLIVAATKASGKH